MERREKWSGWFFSLPGIVFFGLFSLYPMVNSFWVSLFRYDIVSTKQWVGLQNYRSIFSDPVFLQSIRNTLVFVVGSSVPILVFSIFFAVVLNAPMRIRTLYRTLFFVPVILSEVIASVVWMLIFHLNGPLNMLLNAWFGVKPLLWLDSSATAMYAVIVLTVWYRIGYYIVLFLSGLQSIPPDYYEAAMVDGASALRRFRTITLPLLKPTIAFAVTMLLIQGFTVFIPIQLLTNGGPGLATTVMSLHIYNTGFLYMEMGRAAAMSVVLFVGIMLITVFQLRLVFREDR
jgi:multiple sugar transport system permease protein